MRKWQEIVVNIFIGLFVLLLQIYIFNKSPFFGIRINLVLIYIAIIAMFKDIKWSLTTSIIMGIVVDIIFKASLFKYLVIYTIITIIINLIISRYRKENKLATIYIIGLATIMFEIIEYIFYLLKTGTVVNIFSFVSYLIISVILNIMFGMIFILIYNIFEKRKNTYNI